MAHELTQQYYRFHLACLTEISYYCSSIHPLMKVNTIIQIALLLVATVLTYWLVDSIAEPIRFEKERDRRYAQVIDRLKLIRDAQVAYREVKGQFADNWDSLMAVAHTGKFKVTKVIGNPDDSLDVLKGIKYETIYVSVKDSIFRNKSIDSLPYIPFTDGKQFQLRAGKIKKGAVEISVFEVEDTAPFDSRKVLRVGSMSDASLSGNWE